MHISKNKAQQSIRSYFEKIENLRSQLESKKSYSDSEISLLESVQHVRELIEEWKKLDQKITTIFEQKIDSYKLLIQCFKERLWILMKVMR